MIMLMARLMPVKPIATPGGSGFGGVATAKYFRKLEPALSVTLVEPKVAFVTCPFSNWVLGGLRTMGDSTHNCP